MSTAAAHHDSHGDGHHGHHVSSLALLVSVFVILLIMTALTVYTAKYVDIGETGNFILAMAIATFKSTLVCAFFMHLLHDTKFNSVILLYCVITLFLFIFFTKIDLDSRSVVDPRRDGLISPPTVVEDAKKAAAERGDSHGDDHGDDHDDSHADEDAHHGEAAGHDDDHGH